jgi:hypothetical protein
MWGLLFRRLGGAFAMYMVGKHVFPKVEKAVVEKYEDLKSKKARAKKNV